MFGFYWVTVTVLSCLPCEQLLQDLVRRENFGVFIIFIEKYIDQLETKLAHIDPSIVGQHARPLKNNYSKA